MHDKRNSTKTVSMLLASATHWSRYAFKIFPMCVAILIVTTANAFAYINPGFGSFLWQLLLAAFFGIMFYFHRFMQRVWTWIDAWRKVQKRKKTANQEQVNEKR